MFLFSLVIFFAVDSIETAYSFPYTTFAFLVGAITSMLAGYMGMTIATITNVKTTYLCCGSAEDNFDHTAASFRGFKAAFQGGQVLGFCLVGLALIFLEALILGYKSNVINQESENFSEIQDLVRKLFEFVSGYGLGGSTVALFGRVGGGIYTKAADVGADLAGKVMQGLEEDSPKNPGTIADNVGDNVGDIAGMGADLFGSLAESTCAALVVSASSEILVQRPDAIYFPLMVTATGILVSFVTVPIAYLSPAQSVETKLKIQLIVSTVLMSLALLPLTNNVLPPAETPLNLIFAADTYETTPYMAYGCIMLGLWSGLFIGIVTEIYTSKSYRYTQELAEACLYDASTNIIKGLALGYLSNVIPIFCLAFTVLFAFKWAAMYGVALSAIGMLGCLPIALTIDGYGPISDNAGGIAEMSNLHKDVRKRTDELDAAGNTTAAIGKGFAIGSACLVALALFGAFITRVAETTGLPEVYNVNILQPFTFAGLLVGAMLPYWFSAMTMTAVGDAAQEMIAEIRRQKEVIDAGGQPDHESCIAISTEASLKKMIAPGVLVILSPLLSGALFGYKATSGLLAGCIVSGIQIAFSASNSGGAWDNAKKYVEAGMLVVKDADGNERKVKKGDKEHAAAVTGDTVGDPLKDTSGPSINILIKLSAICSLVFGTFLTQYGGVVAGGVERV